MKARFHCFDSYEAEKLSSMFSLQKDNSIFVKEIVNVIDNEVVINLKDGSHHSILFKDEDNALLLKQFFKDVNAKGKEIIFTEFSGDEAFIDFKNKSNE